MFSRALVDLLSIYVYFLQHHQRQYDQLSNYRETRNIRGCSSNAGPRGIIPLSAISEKLLLHLILNPKIDSLPTFAFIDKSANRFTWNPETLSGHRRLSCAITYFPVPRDFISLSSLASLASYSSSIPHSLQLAFLSSLDLLSSFYPFITEEALIGLTHQHQSFSHYGFIHQDFRSR